MFCAYCGKKISNLGEKCQFCGNMPEPLRSFKRLDINTSAVGIDYIENKGYDTYTESRHQEDNVKNHSKTLAKKSSKLSQKLFAMLLCTILIIVAYMCGSRINNNSIISEESYELEGVVKATGSSHLLMLSNPTKIKINKHEFTIDSVYLDPDMNLENIENEMQIQVKGKVLLFKNNQFMIITEEEEDGYGKGI